MPSPVQMVSTGLRALARAVKLPMLISQEAPSAIGDETKQTDTNWMQGFFSPRRGTTRKLMADDKSSSCDDEAPHKSSEMSAEEEKLFRKKRSAYLSRLEKLLDQEFEQEAADADAALSDIITNARTSFGALRSAKDQNPSRELSFRMAANAKFGPSVGDSVLLCDTVQMFTGKHTGHTSLGGGIYAEVIFSKGNELTVVVDENYLTIKLSGRKFVDVRWMMKPSINVTYYERCRSAFKILSASDSSILRVLTGASKPSCLPLPTTLASEIEDVTKETRPDPCLCEQCSLKKTKGSGLVSELAADACLNAAQEAAIAHAVEMNVSLIQGPPGTGKTCTVVQLIKRLSSMIGRKKGRILCVTPSNAAADHLAMCLLRAGLIVHRPRSMSCRKAMHHSDLRLLQSSAMGICHSSLPARPPQPPQRDKSAINRADVVCMSCCYAGGQLSLPNKFEYLIVDEAAQATEPEVLIPFSHINASRLILVGDHKQLGPTVKAMRGKTALAVSLFERLSRSGVQTVMLTEQFRMHASLSLFPSREFYDGKLETSDFVRLRRLEHPALYQHPMKLINVASGRESNKKLSKMNELEAVAVIQEIVSLTGAGVEARSIKVITPYVGQRDLIMSKLASKLKELIHVGSVDSMQGSEADVIIVSTVRSNLEKKLGFVSDPRRMNVTLTRAKFRLILICNVRTLKGNRLWSAYLADFPGNSQFGIPGMTLSKAEAKLHYRKGHHNQLSLKDEVPAGQKKKNSKKMHWPAKQTTSQPGLQTVSWTPPPPPARAPTKYHTRHCKTSKAKASREGPLVVTTTD